MGLQQFEERLERLVEGTLAKPFRSNLQPVEIGRRLTREMDLHRRVGVRGLIAPNVFIVTLAPEAHHKALDLTRTVAAEVEYWPTPDPTIAEGSREQRIDSYRAVRDHLMRRIRDRFAPIPSGNE